MSDYAIQASVKRAHSVDEHHEFFLGNSPESRLDMWGASQLSQNVQSQPLDTLYDSYPMNEEESDSEGMSSDHGFWDE